MYQIRYETFSYPNKIALQLALNFVWGPCPARRSVNRYPTNRLSAHISITSWLWGGSRGRTDMYMYIYNLHVHYVCRVLLQNHHASLKLKQVNSMYILNYYTSFVMNWLTCVMRKNMTTSDREILETCLNDSQGFFKHTPSSSLGEGGRYLCLVQLTKSGSLHDMVWNGSLEEGVNTIPYHTQKSTEIRNQQHNLKG